MVTACNGVEAYQIALKQRIDLIISDVVMPEMDGFELLKRLEEMRTSAIFLLCF